MPTIKDVALKAGVSVGTVSNVLSGVKTVQPDLRKRVEKAVRDLGFKPNYLARSLKQRKTRSLAMVVSDIANPFFPEMVRGAEKAALEEDYLLITFNTDDRIEREKEILETLESRRVDGLLVVVALVKHASAHLEALHSAGTPVVCLDRRPVRLPVDSVTVNNRDGARMCVEHLIEQGHRRIAILTGGADLYVSEDRLDGYRQALSAAGLSVDPTLILEGRFRRDHAREGARLLLARHDRPTAIFSSNSLMTVGVLEAMEECGVKTPRDLALATFDDFAFAGVFHPRLTAVAQPTYQIGYQGAKLLLERLNDSIPRDAPSRHIVLPAELRVRESTLGPRPGRA